MVGKGVISSIDEAKKVATVVPMEASGSVTTNLVIPYFLIGCLSANMPVIYATFNDNTGILLARADGEFNHKIIGGLEVTESITAAVDVTGGGISLKSHIHGYTHGGTSSGADNTTPPK